MSDKIIVKVQLPLNNSDDGYEHPALIYNEDRSYQVFMAVDESLLKSMAGDDKKYFYATADHDNHDTILHEEATGQHW